MNTIQYCYLVGNGRKISQKQCMYSESLFTKTSVCNNTGIPYILFITLGIGMSIIRIVVDRLLGFGLFGNFFGPSHPNIPGLTVY